MIPFGNFYCHVQRDFGLSHIYSPLNQLWRIMGNRYMLGTQIDKAGMVTYTLRVDDIHSVRERTTSFAKFVRYLSQVDPTLAQINWQPVQDYLIKWAGEELSDDRWTFEEVVDEELFKAYRDGPKSCMSGKKAQMQLYMVNPDKVALLKIMDRGVYVGRALVWTTDSGERVLDRIYPGNGRQAAAARQHAKANGWKYRNVDSIGADDLNNSAVRITLRHVKNRRLPYLDTMGFLAELTDDHLVLTNFARSENKVRYIQVGSYYGYSSIYHPYTYTDGTPAVKDYVLESDIEYYVVRQKQNQVIISFAKNNRTTYAYHCVKPDETVYYLPGARHATMSRKIVQASNGLYYLKTNVRKRRGQAVYDPKPGAVGYGVNKAESRHFNNGAIRIQLEVPDAST
jgi:hypothetical protein